MKRYVSFLLCALFLLQPVLGTPAYAAGTPTIVCEDVTCEPGERITVAVTIENNPGFMYLELTPTYSSELTFVNAVNGELISDFTKNKQYVWIADEDATEDGLLMTFTFDVAETVPAGAYSVGFVVRMCGNYDEVPVEFSVKSGTICVGGEKTVEHQYVVNGETMTDTYGTLEEALAVADSGTIKLLADATMDTVILKPDVILDINGYTLTADKLIAMNGGKVTDGGNTCIGGGFLKIAKENLALAQDNGGVIPVWNEADGYVFTKVTFQQLARKAGEGAAQYIFLPQFSNTAVAAMFTDGGADNAIKMKVGLSWNNGQCQQFYTYGDDLVEKVFSSNGKLVFSLTITGISDITNMVANAIVATDSGAQSMASATKIETINVLEQLQYEFGHDVLTNA